MVFTVLTIAWLSDVDSLILSACFASPAALLIWLIPIILGLAEFLAKTYHQRQPNTARSRQEQFLDPDILAWTKPARGLQLDRGGDRLVSLMLALIIGLEIAICGSSNSAACATLTLLTNTALIYWNRKAC